MPRKAHLTDAQKALLKKPPIPPKPKAFIYESRASTTKGAKLIFRKLYPKNSRHVALVDVGTGGGKTYMAIHTIGAWKPNAHLIILTPKKQVNAHHFEYSIQAYNKATGSRLTADVWNYEAFSESKARQNAFIKYLQLYERDHHQPLFLIADEGHRIKEPTSNTFKFIVKMAKNLPIEGMIILTATPGSNSLLDYQSYLILAGYYRNKTDFERQHVRMRDDHFQPIVKDYSGHIRLDYLRNPKQIIDEVKSIQVKIDTKHLLPPVKYHTLEFPFDKTTQKQYRQIVKNYKNGLYDSIQETIQHQIQFVATHATQRLKVMQQIIDNPRRPKDPVFIFYNYDIELETLRENLPQLLPNYNIVEANGHNNQFDINSVKSPNTLILAQYKAVGEGVNGAFSHLSIFFAPTFSWQDFQQARGRNVRAGQQGTVVQVRFVVPKTINAHYWYDLVDQKKRFTKKLQHYFVTGQMKDYHNLFNY